MNRTTFVTGASSGLGAALAARLAERGDRVALVARRADRLEEEAARIRKAGGAALPIPCDITDREAVHAAVRHCEAELGPVDLLVANAGIDAPLRAVDFDAGALEATFRVNLFGAAYCFEAVLPGMVERGSGHLVGISSLAGYNGLPGNFIYSASKAALSNLMEGMRLDLQRYGIVVTTICPGFIRTEMTDAYPYPMPFLMDLDAGTRQIYGAIERREAEYAFPWPLAFVAKGARLLPGSLKGMLAQGFFPEDGAKSRGEG